MKVPFSRPRGLSDLVLAFAVVCMIAIMILRVPQAALDALIAANIAISVVVLMVALYAADASKLPSFPTILLLTTLLRLSLNVSSTKLILLEANAGKVIETFGNFVVGGNYVVGGIVFLVLVLIQFIVVAKGSERVAEVSARFTLDALPGKQVSLEADLRNGLIDKEKARRLRNAMERESRLYGAMDGAMKFVKGDAIAGILISIVNIVGGLIVGSMDGGQTLSEAARTYTLLTIGDGLVSQIPSLLISLAAGLVVTRVAMNDVPEGGNLASDMATQVFENPRSLFVAACLLGAIGISGPLTGFPMLPFLGLAMLCGFGAFHGSRGRIVSEEKPVSSGARGEKGASPGSRQPARPSHRLEFEPDALVIEFHESLEFLFLSAEDVARRPETRVDAVLAKVSKDLGLQIPKAILERKARRAPRGGYAIHVRGARVARGTLVPSMAYVRASVEELQARSIQAKACQLPGSHAPHAMISIQDAAAARGHGFYPLPPLAAMLFHLDAVLRREASEFLGIQEVANLLERLKERRRELVDAVVPELLKVAQLTDVLKQLLRERVPIADLPRILESLARWVPSSKSLSELLERTRTDLRRSLCASLVTPAQGLCFYTLSASLDDRLRESLHGAPLEPEEEDSFRDALQAALASFAEPEGAPCLVVRPELRRLVRDTLAPVLPELSVLSHAELSAEYDLHELGRISLSA